jgi:hypothetical protein
MFRRGSFWIGWDLASSSTGSTSQLKGEVEIVEEVSLYHFYVDG